MRLLRLILFALVCRSSSLPAAELKTIDNFQAAAAKANRVLSVPEWEQTPKALTAAIMDAIAKGNAALDQIGSQDLGSVTFASTIVALDDLRSRANLVANRAALISETNPDPAMHAAAESALRKFQEWNVAIDYREDVFKAIEAFAVTRPELTGEDEKLFNETLRDFRRAGVDLPRETRKEVEQMRHDLSTLAAEFDNNLLTATAPVVFTRAELDGVPDDFLSSVKIDNDRYQVMAHLMWQYNTVEDNARSEATRKRLYIAHDSLAKEKNVPVINQMLALRNRIALRLGYKSWADYQAEVRMAKVAANAQQYIDNLAAGIQPKFDAELRELQPMKAVDTNDPHAKIDIWDWRYYTNQLNKQKFAVDKESLRTFFPLEQTVDAQAAVIPSGSRSRGSSRGIPRRNPAATTRDSSTEPVLSAAEGLGMTPRTESSGVLRGMFAIFGRVFGLRFDEIKPPSKWTNELRLYVVSDAASNAPLGLLYLDLFPREGKTGGGGESEIVNGRRLADGKYQAPATAVILNFPPPNGDKPSLLNHSDAEILFHELGHALHCILTRAKYNRFAGTHVPVDFVEAPSQMLQNWIWDKKVLDTFAVDYRDRSKKIPAETIKKLNEAKVATAGMFYRRQFAFALLDLALHGPHPTDEPYDCLAISNPILERVFLPIDQQTSFITGFRGFNGYDAGYYGYAWSDAIAADMATVFEKAGYLDKGAGMKLRREIYEPGDSRDVTMSIQKFLGRQQSIEPFLRKLGIRSTAR